jgi:hypothetical protein
MKNILSPLHLIFIVLGAAGGFGYYYFIGCSTGSCPLKSNPWIMTGYGALVGYLITMPEIKGSSGWRNIGKKKVEKYGAVSG